MGDDTKTIKGASGHTALYVVENGSNVVLHPSVGRPIANFLEDIPIDVLRASPNVVEMLHVARSAGADEWAALASLLQAEVSTLDYILDQGIGRQHISLIRRCAIRLSIDTSLEREMERNCICL